MYIYSNRLLYFKINSIQLEIALFYLILNNNISDNIVYAFAHRIFKLSVFLDRRILIFRPPHLLPIS